VAKKKMQIPEDNLELETPESQPDMVWVKKIKTMSSGPLGTFYKGGIYEVPWTTWLEFQKNDEAIIVEQP
jgi:hypothetical protein